MYNDYLRTGITALANTDRDFPGNWFMGHYGAAVLAGAFMLSDKQVHGEAAAAVRVEINRVSRVKPELLQPMLVDDEESSLQPLIEQLEKNLQALSNDGHAVIYAALALRAFSQRPELITVRAVSGIVKLLQNAAVDDPKRYYGIEDYQNLSVSDDDVKPFDTVEYAARRILSEHEQVIPDQVINGKKYFVAGSQLHLITHMHALVELDQLGFKAQAKMGLSSIRKQLYVINKEKEAVDADFYTASQVLDPREPSFWKRGKKGMHQLKLAYAVLSLMDFLNIEQQQETLSCASKYWELSG
jgi:hypothetical protein